MSKPNGLDRKSLQTQLENCRLVAELNQELFDKNLFTQEGFPGRLELAQSYINESRRWEELGDQDKSHDALTTANLIIVEISAVIKNILNQDTSSGDNYLQLDQTAAS